MENKFKITEVEKKEVIRLTELARRKVAYKAFEYTLEALKEDNRVNTAELQKNHLEGKIERSSWTVKKMILDQEKRCIEQIEALYLSRNTDEAYKRYLEFEYEIQKRALKEANGLQEDENYIQMRKACVGVYETCLLSFILSFDKAYETTKERP